MAHHADAPSFAAGPAVAQPSLRVRFCADGTPAHREQSCSYHSFVSTRCWEEQGQDGPVRRCKRTLEKFRDCGRGREEVEHFDEEIVDTNFQGGPAELQDHEQPFRPPEPVPHVDQPLDSQLEEAVEDILRYAAELQQAARRRSGKQQSDAADQKESLRHRMQSLALPYLLQRQAVPPAGKDISPGRARAKQCWDEFQEHFQEV